MQTHRELKLLVFCNEEAAFEGQGNSIFEEEVKNMAVYLQEYYILAIQRMHKMINESFVNMSMRQKHAFLSGFAGDILSMYESTHLINKSEDTFFDLDLDKIKMFNLQILMCLNKKSEEILEKYEEYEK